MRHSVVPVPDAEFGGYVAYVAYVPVAGVTIQGESIDDALGVAAEAVGIMRDAMVDDTEDVPVEHPGVLFTSIAATLGESVRVGGGAATRGEATVMKD